MSLPVGMENLDGGFRWDFGTEAGRAAVRRFVDQCVANKRLKQGEESGEPVKCKHAWKSGASPFSAAFIHLGLRLREPFHRADMLAAGRMTESRASNVLTAWREQGWIVGCRIEGWRRTPEFGKGAA